MDLEVYKERRMHFGEKVIISKYGVDNSG